MSRHRREVAHQIKADKEKQLEPVQRRTTARQKAAQEELVQARLLQDTSFDSHGISTKSLQAAADDMVLKTQLAWNHEMIYLVAQCM